MYAIIVPYTGFQMWNSFDYELYMDHKQNSHKGKGTWHCMQSGLVLEMGLYSVIRKCLPMHSKPSILWCAVIISYLRVLIDSSFWW